MKVGKNVFPASGEGPGLLVLTSPALPPPHQHLVVFNQLSVVSHRRRCQHSLSLTFVFFLLSLLAFRTPSFLPGPYHSFAALTCITTTTYIPSRELIVQFCSIVSSLSLPCLISDHLGCQRCFYDCVKPSSTHGQPGGVFNRQKST